jgi:hypothetical protein
MPEAAVLRLLIMGSLLGTPSSRQGGGKRAA